MTKLNENQIQIMKDDMTVELAEWLMGAYGYDSKKALEVLYTSKTFERLQHSSTGLYFQSVGYVSSFLKNEIEKSVFC